MTALQVPQQQRRRRLACRQARPRRALAWEVAPQWCATRPSSAPRTPRSTRGGVRDTCVARRHPHPACGATRTPSRPARPPKTAQVSSSLSGAKQGSTSPPSTATTPANSPTPPASPTLHATRSNPATSPSTRPATASATSCSSTASNPTAPSAPLNRSDGSRGVTFSTVNWDRATAIELPVGG
jgi:hypothetical protein